jgi:hypothetical protein
MADPHRKGMGQMQLNQTDEIGFTHHALARIRQRGVRSEALSLVLAEADQQHYVGGGAIAERISRDKRKRLQRTGIACTLLDAACQLVVVFAEDGAVMTVISHPSHRGRVYLGGELANPRRRVMRNR